MEELFIKYSHQVPALKKFVPLSSDYPEEDNIQVVRHHINFELNWSDYMQWRVYADFHEPVYDFIRNYLDDSGIVVDVGANIGAFSLNIAKIIIENELNDQHIIAFEPNPEIAKMLINNISLNPNFIDLIEVHSLACGNENRKSSLVFNPANSGGGRIVESERVTVNMVRLDDHLKDMIDQVRILKIDVEGFEPEVIKGAKEIITESRPLIYMEVTDSWYRALGITS